jgi:type IX secretion system PorP/SprF family membrane protein
MNKMKKTLFFLAIMIASGTVVAQQEAHFTQFMYNKMSINPGYAGSRGVPSFTAIYRSQWMGFKGAPQSALVSFNGPFLTDRVGVGITLQHLKIGLQRDFVGAVAYSYDVVAEEDVSVRIGLAGQIRSLGIAYEKATVVDNGDNAVSDQKETDIYGNVGAGIYSTFMNRFYFGVSVPRLYSNVIGFTNTTGLLAKEYQHFYAMGGAIIPLSEDISIMPAVLLKYVKNAPFDADINLNLDIRKKFTAGISYRVGGDGPGDSVDLLAYWQATDKVGVGAAYDFTLSKLKDYSTGSIELLLQADLKSKKSKKLSNPRFFM